MIHSLAAVAGVGVLTFALWADFGSTPDWKITGPFGGTATTVALDQQHPNVLLAGGRGSLLFRSEDAGADWHPLAFPKLNLSEVTSVLFDPADSDHYLIGVYAADGGGLFESRDAGKVWHRVLGMKDFGVRALAVAPSKSSRFIAGTMAGVWLSDDSGKTWARISDPANLEMSGITAVAFDTKNPDVIYAGTPHLPWKTVDAGKTWESIHNGMIDDSDVFSIYVDPNDPASVLASACSGIYSSSDRGDLWHKLLGIPNTSRRTHVVREDPLNPNVIYAGTTMGLFRSINHGLSWKSVTDQQVNAMAADPSNPNQIYLALEFAGIGKSSSSGEQIIFANQGFVDRNITAETRSGSRLFAIEPNLGDGSGLFASADNGLSWLQIQDARGLGTARLRAVTGMQSDGHLLLSASSHQLYKSVDGGHVWKAIPIRIVSFEQPKALPARKAPVRRSAKARPLPPPKPIQKIHEVTSSDIASLFSVKVGAQELLFAATDLGLLRSRDGGEHWTVDDIPSSSGVQILYSSPGNSDLLVAKTAVGLYISKDCGEHWEPLGFPLPPSEINDIALPSDPMLPILIATQRGLYMSEDGGEKWSANLGGIPASTVSAVLYSAQKGTAYAVEYGQLFQSTDGIKSWNVVSSRWSNLRIKRLWMPDLATGRLFGVTSDLGILVWD